MFNMATKHGKGFLQTLQKLNQIAPKIGFSRIVSFASKTDAPGAVEHRERGNALETKAMMNFGFGVKGKRDGYVSLLSERSESFRSVIATVAGNQNKVDVAILTEFGANCGKFREFGNAGHACRREEIDHQNFSWLGRQDSGDRRRIGA